MRADRLLSLLLLLQTRGRMTARQLADELEVSERTVYRDIDALSVAGVPLYADRGPEGGYALMDSYRTTLTGLTEPELRALFVLSIPAPLHDLGLSRELRSALLKLSAALPDSRRSALQELRGRVYLDAVWWFQGGENLPYLQTIQDAVWADHLLVITYRQRYGAPVNIEQTVAPYGLVAKAGVWYLVYALSGSMRVQRVSRLLEVVPCAERFERPVDFDLGLFWRGWCARFEQKRPAYRVTLRAAPELRGELTRIGGEEEPVVADRARQTAASPSAQSDWVIFVVVFESLPAARDYVLGQGAALEVLAPLPLRMSIVDYARQICARYGSD